MRAGVCGRVCGLPTVRGAPALVNHRQAWLITLSSGCDSVVTFYNGSARLIELCFILPINCHVWYV